MNANTTENELDTIRIRHYEATKDMTTNERVAYIKAQIAPTLKQFNMRVVTQTVRSPSKSVKHRSFAGNTR